MNIFSQKNQAFKAPLLSKIWTIVLLVSTVVVSMPAMGSAEICIDHLKDKIHINAHYYFYGDEATSAVASPCIAEINRMFNLGHKIQLRKEGSFKDIVTKVTYSIISEEDALELAQGNTSSKKNFVRIGNVTSVPNGDISRHGLKSNWGFFVVQNNLGQSTTCSHEFAHGLGLDHSTTGFDWRGKGVPPIMAPRGSLVDKIYQRDPNAKAGAAGGTLDPKHRQIHVQEYTNLKLGALDYSWRLQEKECADLGSAQNIIFKSNGTILPRPGKTDKLKWATEFFKGLVE
jgi:hypothetical protein